jgi:hypothetical protein
LAKSTPPVAFFVALWHLHCALFATKALVEQSRLPMQANANIADIKALRLFDCTLLARDDAFAFLIVPLIGLKLQSHPAFSSSRALTAATIETGTPRDSQ